MTSPDLTVANIEKLADLFPMVMTESVDADGNVKMAVDFDLLRQELAQAPPRTKAATLAALPQMYGRASEKVLAAKVVESALVDELAHPATGPVAWVSLGRLRLAHALIQQLRADWALGQFAELA